MRAADRLVNSVLSHELSVPLCLFLCERTCLSVREGYKNTESARECSRYYLVVSLCHEHKWLSTAEECFAQTVSGARLSPRMCGARTLYIYNHSSRGMSVSETQVKRVSEEDEPVGWR